MKRRVPLLLFLAILVAGGVALRVRRAAARDRELAELLAGPFLPGAAVMGNSWYFAIAAWPGGDCKGPTVSGETVLHPGAETPTDIVVTRAASAEPDGAFAVAQWTVRAGSSTESRFIDFLRTIRDEGLLVPAEPGKTELDAGVRALWQGIFSDGFPEDVDWMHYSTLDEEGVRRIHERVSRFFETEAARGDVVVREERGASLCFSFHDPFRTEPPGLFRRAIGRVCGAIGRPELYSVSEWAERKRSVPDPLLPLAGRDFAIVPGAPREGRLYRFSVDSSEKEPPRSFTVADGTPLADAFRSLCAKYEPWTLGTPVPPLPPSELYLADKPMLQGKTGTNEWAVAIDRSTPRLRAFLTDLLRLFADPPPDTRPSLQ